VIGESSSSDIEDISFGRASKSSLQIGTTGMCYGPKTIVVGLSNISPWTRIHTRSWIGNEITF